ncbi:sensor histidine kinase [Sagittula salina]|uniref:histidine kinase n=1 Tax=Sagittula salina TaxID=2820268 RepID=A0A940S3C4_9RHOB|nr:PAS domain-containing sensor histidine kinase [Sagittula salina]MBP0482899.1 hypothetical protein [Sagittula salina]
MLELEKALLDQLDHMVFVVEPDGDGVPRYAHVNRLALQSLGVNLPDILGKTALDLYPGAVGVTAYGLHVEVLQSGEARRYEVFHPLRGQTTLVPQKNAEGRVVRLVGSSRPRSVPSLVGDPVAEAEDRNRELQAFVHLAAHDLRTPMRQVGSLAELLREGTEDPELIELIDMLHEVSDSALSLIGDVLTHADTTGTVEQVTAFTLDALVEPVVAMLDPPRRIRLQVQPAALEMDSAGLLVVIRNLFDNAVKYAWADETGQGAAATHGSASDAEPHLRISVTEGGANLLVFTVEDNGCGLLPERLALFNGDARSEKGRFGIMAIRSLLGQRGGWLRAENAEAGGARIHFALPGAFSCASQAGRRRILF